MNEHFKVTIILLILGIFNSTASAQEKYMLKGFVYDGQNGKPIPDANISVPDTKSGTNTDAEGSFELGLAPGKYKIRASSIGFISKELIINVSSENNEPYYIRLLPNTTQIGDVDIVGHYQVKGNDTSATREPLSVLPAITYISPADIQKQGAVTLTDALKFVPGGWTENRGRKSKQFFSVRGQKYPYPEYSIDGVWQREFEETAYFLSALDIESIEVIRSGNAIVKGLSGLTGIIDVKTSQPQCKTYSFRTQYGQNNSNETLIQYGNKIRDLSFSTSAAYFGTDGIPGRGGKERIANFHGNVNWNITSGLMFSGGTTYIYGLREFVSIVEPGSPSILNMKEKFDPLHSLITYAKISYRGKDRSETEIQTNLTYRIADYKSYNIKNESLTTHLDKDWEYGVNLIHSRMLSQKNTLRTGWLYNHWVAPDGKRYYAGRRCNLHTWSGVVADEQIAGHFIFDAAFRIIGGYIVEWGGFGIEGSAAGFQNVESLKDQSSPVEWQSSLGSSYSVSGTTSVHYSFSGGSLAPRAGSLNGEGTAPENERRFQHELGLRFKTQNRSEISVSSFFTQRRNALDLSGNTVTAANGMIVELYENLDKRSYGLELTAKAMLTTLHSSFFLNAMFMKSEKKEGVNMVDDKQIPNIILNSGVTYEHSGFDANIFANYTGSYTNNRFVNPAWIVENGDYQLGGFVSADLNIGYTISGKVPVRFFIEVKNILDKEYETVACYPDAGRLLMAGVKFKY